MNDFIVEQQRRNKKLLSGFKSANKVGKKKNCALKDVNLNIWSIRQI